jgi:hypothetical protein
MTHTACLTIFADADSQIAYVLPSLCSGKQFPSQVEAANDVWRRALDSRGIALKQDARI